MLPRPLLALGLVPSLVLAPLTVALGTGFLAVRGLRGNPSGRAALARACLAWALRAALAIAFVLAVVDLWSDLAVLTAE